MAQLFLVDGASGPHMDVEDLLRILLVLVVVWIALEVLTDLLELLLGPVFALVKPLIGLVVLALIVLWLLDRL